MAVKVLVSIIESLVVEQLLEDEMNLDLYGVLWSLGIQYMVGTVMLLGFACKDVAIR